GLDPALRTIRRHVNGSPVGVLFIGTWSDRKGVPELSAAWSTLIAEGVNARLTVMGTGVADSRVLSDFSPAARRTLSPIASFDRERLLAELSRHSVYVLASGCEGMPLATLEAAAAGLACCVSVTPGHTDIFREPASEEDGAVMIPPHDARAL